MIRAQLLLCAWFVVSCSSASIGWKLRYQDELDLMITSPFPCGDSSCFIGFVEPNGLGAFDVKTGSIIWARQLDLEFLAREDAGYFVHLETLVCVSSWNCSSTGSPCVNAASCYNKVTGAHVWRRECTVGFDILLLRTNTDDLLIICGWWDWDLRKPQERTASPWIARADRNGSKVWNTTLSSNFLIWMWAGYGHSTVLINDESNVVMHVNTTTGQLLWHATIHDQFLPISLPSSAGVLCPGWENLTMLDNVTGKLKWHKEMGETGHWDSRVSHDGWNLIVSRGTNQSQKIAYLEADTGHELWNWPANTSEHHGAWWWTCSWANVPGGDDICFVGYDYPENVGVLSINTGQLLYSPIPGLTDVIFVQHLRPLDSRPNLLVYWGDHALFAIDAPTGKVEWQVPDCLEGEFKMSQDNLTLYVACRPFDDGNGTGTLLGIDPLSGSQRWSLTIQMNNTNTSSTSSSPAALKAMKRERRKFRNAPDSDATRFDLRRQMASSSLLPRSAHAEKNRVSSRAFLDRSERHRRSSFVFSKKASSVFPQSPNQAYNFYDFMISHESDGILYVQADWLGFDTEYYYECCFWQIIL